jgi:cell division protein FtsB
MKYILITLVIILAFLQYDFWFAKDGVLEAVRLKRNISELKIASEAIAKHNAHLINEIASLKRGGAAIEHRARNDLGMIKPGEVFYQIIR